MQRGRKERRRTRNAQFDHPQRRHIASLVKTIAIIHTLLGLGPLAPLQP